MKSSMHKKNEFLSFLVTSSYKMLIIIGFHQSCYNLVLNDITNPFKTVKVLYESQNKSVGDKLL